MVEGHVPTNRITMDYGNVTVINVLRNGLLGGERRPLWTPLRSARGRGTGNLRRKQQFSALVVRAKHFSLPALIGADALT
jgi:hypothetical protein